MQTADERTRLTSAGRDSSAPRDDDVDRSRRAWFTIRTLLITVGGLVLRLGYTDATKRTASLGILTDSRWYFVAGKLLAEGWGFGNPLIWSGQHHRYVASAGHPPLYPLFLGTVGRLGFTSTLDARFASCVLGAAAIPLLALTARDLGGNRTGIIAALIAALYPALWINDSMLLSETPFIFFVALFMFAAVRYWRRPGFARVALVSLALGLASLTRSEAVLLLPLGVLPLVLRAPGASWRTRLGQLGAALLVAAAVIGPWVVYNNVDRFEKPLFIVSGSGVAQSYGNCDATYSGKYLGYWYWKCGVGEIPGNTDETVLDAHARAKATHYIKTHLSDQPRVVAARVGRMFHIYRVGQSLEFDRFFEVRGIWGPRLALYAYYPITLLGLGGIVVLWRRRQLVSPYVAVAATAVISAALTFGITRYRAGFDAAAVVPAAIAIDALIRAMTRGRASGDGPPAPTAPSAVVSPTAR